jgi:hypothetical protein
MALTRQGHCPTALRSSARRSHLGDSFFGFFWEQSKAFDFVEKAAIGDPEIAGGAAPVPLIAFKFTLEEAALEVFEALP